MSGEREALELTDIELRHVGHLVDQAASLARFNVRDERDAMARAAIDALAPFVTTHVAAAVEEARKDERIKEAQRIEAAIKARADDDSYTWVSGRHALNHAASIARAKPTEES